MRGSIVGHEHADAVAHSFLLCTQCFDALLRVAGEGLQLAFLAGREVADYLGDVEALLWSTAVLMRTLGVEGS